MLTNIIIFMSGNHFLILGHQMVTLKKIELGALHYHVYANNNKIINTMALIVLHTDSKNALCQTRTPAWLRQSLLLTQRLCMGCIYHSVEAEKCFTDVNKVYQGMINSKRWSWEECKRDSSIPEKWFELLNKCKKSGKWSTLCFMEWQGSQKRIQGSLQFYPFSWMLQFSSSKSIKCFFINLKQF